MKKGLRWRLAMALRLLSCVELVLNCGGKMGEGDPAEADDEVERQLLDSSESCWAAFCLKHSLNGLKKLRPG